MSDSPGLVDFAVGLTDSVLNFPDGQVRFCGEFTVHKNCNQSCSSKFFFGIVHVSYSLPEWQAVKLICPLLPVSRWETETDQFKIARDLFDTARYF